MNICSEMGTGNPSLRLSHIIIYLRKAQTQSQNKISVCCIFAQGVLQFKSNLCSGNHRQSLDSEKFHYDIRFKKKMFFQILQVPDILNSYSPPV